MSKFTRTLSVAALLGALASLSACHTVEGVGKDVQEVGEEVEEAAEDTRT
jgi:predicted small secreted protein